MKVNVVLDGIEVTLKVSDHRNSTTYIQDFYIESVLLKGVNIIEWICDVTYSDLEELAKAKIDGDKK